MVKTVVIVAAILLLAGAVLGYYLFRALPLKPRPAGLHCYDLENGSYVPLEAPPQAFGIGLSYAGHIEETASTFDPNATPPVFRKDVRALARTDETVHLPSKEALCEAADSLEPGLGERLQSRYDQLSPLLDYEVEMGMVLLQDIDPQSLDDPSFVPHLGFFIANDLSARTLAILGDGRPNTHDYWGVSKSFAGFMPVGDRAWVPRDPRPDTIPCVVIESSVNGDVRQQQSTEDLIYTPRQMIGFVHEKYPEASLQKGTMILTGTPGGVALSTPRWLVRLSGLLGLSRFTKLDAKLDGDTERFLKPGDKVLVRGKGLGKVVVRIAEPLET
ncbi:MAG: fumarylacetoacetate hydrolase family protein [Myxococcales bacterium]|jgi:2-keto-4-pentenoate hydratase/2-oxohepta-3-ene-1,7-dioic acid hydratase in catechol pathway